MSNIFVIEFYDKPTEVQPTGRVLVLEDTEDAGSVAEELKVFFDQLRLENPQFYDAGLMCARFVHWKLAQYERAGSPPGSRKVVLIKNSTEVFDCPIAEVYANSYRPEVRFRRTEAITEDELLIAAEVLQQANI